MAAFNKFEQFVLDLGLKVHELNADLLKIYLSNAAPSVSADVIKTDIAEITAENGYTAGGDDTQNTYTEATGTGSCVGTDVTFTASGGTIGPFQYVVLYNDTPSSPLDPLIGWWDHGSAVTLQDGETFTVDFGATMFTIV
jgi:hypothetical protein